MSELKSCPFCGGEAWIRISDAPQILRVECRRCHVATTSFVADSIGEEEAVEAWNTRADYHGFEQAAIDAWQSIKAWNTRHVETCHDKNGFDESLGFECTVCRTMVDSYMQTTYSDKREQLHYCPCCGRKVVDE